VTTILTNLREPVVVRKGVYVPQQDSQLLINTLERTTAVAGRRSSICVLAAAPSPLPPPWARRQSPPGTSAHAQSSAPARTPAPQGLRSRSEEAH
jgi:hypothetical protein